MKFEFEKPIIEISNVDENDVILTSDGDVISPLALAWEDDIVG